LVAPYDDSTGSALHAAAELKGVVVSVALQFTDIHSVLRIPHSSHSRQFSHARSRRPSAKTCQRARQMQDKAATVGSTPSSSATINRQKGYF